MFLTVPDAADSPVLQEEGDVATTHYTLRNSTAFEACETEGQKDGHQLEHSYLWMGNSPAF